MADVFVSYAREDKAFVRKLTDALKPRGHDSWVDWEDIEPSDAWRQAIHEAIDAADALLLVISPHSLASQPCLDEMTQATNEHKRLIPVVCRDVEGLPVPDAVGDLQWIFARDQDKFEDALGDIDRALDLDLGLVRIHTTVLTRAKAWQAAGRRPTPLLRGEELRAAEGWLARAAGGAEPQPTELQAAFVEESRDRSQRRLRYTAGGALGVATVAIALMVFALIQRSQARTEAKIALSRELAARSVSEFASDPVDSIRLSLQALRTKQTPDAVHSLSRALDASRLRYVLHQPSPVVSVGFSPDGSELAAGGMDGGLRLWNPAERRVVWSTGPGGDPPTTIAFAHAGDVIVLARSPFLGTGKGCAVQVLDARTGAVKRTLVHMQDASCSVYVAFVAATREVAIATANGAVALANVDTGALVGTVGGLQVPNAFISGIAVSRDGKRLAAVDGGNHVVRVLGIGSGRVIDVIRARTLALFNPASVAFGAQNTELMIGGEYNTELDNTEFHTAIQLDTDFGSAAVALSPDGRLAAAAVKAAAPVWSAVNGRRVETLPARSSQAFYAVAFSSHNALAGGSQDGTISIWEPDPDRPQTTFSAGYSSLGWAAVASSKGIAAVGDASQSVFITDASGHVQSTNKPHGASPFALTADGLFVYNRSGRLYEVRLASGASVRSWGFPKNQAAVAIVTSASGAGVASVSERPGTPPQCPCELTVFSPRGPRTKQIPFVPPSAYPLSMSGDGRLLTLIGSPNASTVTVMRPNDLAVVRRFTATAAALSPSGRLLALERPDLSIALIRTSDWSTQTTLRGETFGAAQVAFSTDGRILVALDDAANLRAWDTSDAALLSTRYVVEGRYAGRYANPQLAVTRAGLALVGLGESNFVGVYDVCSICLNTVALRAQGEARLRQIVPVNAR